VSVDEAALRREVRAFIAEQVRDHGVVLECDAWLSGFDRDFTRAMGARGWLGMTWPTQYGGHGRSERERLIVNEELLAAGAPVAAHWIGDRQSGPSILKHGTEEQKQRFLPAMARGECLFAIGMSEPDSGSDLASVRTTGRRDGDHWVINGTKVWTSGAHEADYAIALVRTSPLDPSARHAGLSQFVIDLRSPGVTINPILMLDGGHHFNEVVFDDLRLTDADLLGREGDGWKQVTSELAYERSGPERFLSTFPLLATVAKRSDGNSAELGVAIAELTTLRAMSAAVADKLQKGQAPAVDAALVKDLGTRFEGRVIDLARRAHRGEIDPGSADDLQRHLAHATAHAPGFTLRGGTNEILRGIVAKSIPTGMPPAAGEIAEALGGLCASVDVYDPAGRWSPDQSRALLKRVLADGWHRVGLPEELGGQGGDIADAAQVAAAVVGSPSPLADVVLTATHVTRRSGLVLPDDAEVVVVAPGRTAARVPWASWASHVLVPAADGDGTRIDLIPVDPARVTPGRNMADEPRDAIDLGAEPVATGRIDAPLDAVLREIELAGALTRSLQIAAALAKVVGLTSLHVADRVQFGRALVNFQAVQQSLAELAAEASASAAICDAALTGAATPRAALLIGAAKARTGLAAGTGARIAHQLHGAIGISQEHALQRYTRPLWSWRDEYGGETTWGARLAAQLAAEADGELWPWLVGV
jgi:alkylation response protein AidB-like acyl-CoA dehydrogenase